VAEAQLSTISSPNHQRFTQAERPAKPAWGFGRSHAVLFAQISAPELHQPNHEQFAPDSLLAGFIGQNATATLQASDRVVVVANADQGYTDRKFGDGKAARESYIIMQGRFYPGTTVDRTLERMSVQDVVAYLVPQLAEQEFLHAKTIGEADLMLAVHWG